MKKVLVMLGVVLLAVNFAMADSVSVTVTVTNGQAATFSDLIPASGWLDRIEVRQDSSATSTIVVATYDGTTAVETFATLSGLTDAQKVVRPRLIGTTTAGVALAAVAAGSTAALTNAYASTVLVAPYERPLIGGNLKARVTGTANDGSNPVTVTVFFEPLKK